MARTATSIINIQASPTGLTIDTSTPIILYKGPFSNGNIISPSTLGYSSLTVQNLVDGICIPSGVITSDINQIDVFIASDCQIYETILLEQIPTPTPTPTPTATASPTPTSLAPSTPTPTPTSTAATTFYRTNSGTSGNSVCCSATTIPIYFSGTNTFDGYPTFGSIAYIDANLTSVFNGGGLYYGILEDYYNGPAQKYVYIDTNGYVGANSGCPC